MVHRPTLAEVGQQWIVHLVRSMVSSSSSSKLGQDNQNLIRERREVENLYSKATLEVGQLKQYLDVVKASLSTSEEETNVA